MIHCSCRLDPVLALALELSPVVFPAVAEVQVRVQVQVQGRTFGAGSGETPGCLGGIGTGC